VKTKRGNNAFQASLGREYKIFQASVLLMQ